MGESPVLVVMLLIAGAAVLSVAGLRGVLEIHQALHDADFARLAAPAHWPATRAFGGLCAALPVYFVTSSLGPGAWAAAALVGGLGFAVMPKIPGGDPPPCRAGAARRAGAAPGSDRPGHGVGQ